MGYKVSVFLGAGYVVKEIEDRLRAFASDRVFGSRDEITEALREFGTVRFGWETDEETGGLILRCGVPLARIEPPDLVGI